MVTLVVIVVAILITIGLPGLMILIVAPWVALFGPKPGSDSEPLEPDASRRLRSLLGMRE